MLCFFPRCLNPLNASRCFNCSTYGHSLNECPKPRDNLAISNARKEHQLRKNQNGGPHVSTRYYQNTPRGKYDGLKPGALDAETRKLLGLAVIYLTSFLEHCVSCLEIEYCFLLEEDFPDLMHI